MALVGPGAIQDNEIAPSPTLEGASEYEYVTIKNPLTDDFAVRVAQDIPVNMPFEIKQDTSGKTSAVTKNESQALQMYGLNLKNSDFVSRQHVFNDTIIKAGQTLNLKGNEAQVAVRQIVNEVLQRRGLSRMLADPTKRKEVEDEIIVGRGLVQDLMDQTLQSTRSQLNEAVNRSNEVQDEQPFAELTPKRVGRPKKAEA